MAVKFYTRSRYVGTHSRKVRTKSGTRSVTIKGHSRKQYRHR